MSTSNVDRPGRMYRNDRPIDPEFKPDEELYLRCAAGDVDGDRLSPISIKFPDQSVNRQKYSEPEDVLIPHWLTWGVAAFRVGDVPPALQLPGGPQFTFKTEHVPEPDNYAHSEVRTYKDGQHSRDVDPPKTLKKLFRQLLSEKTRIIRTPQQ